MAVSGYRKFVAVGDMLQGACISVFWPDRVKVASCLLATAFNLQPNPRGEKAARDHLLDPDRSIESIGDSCGLYAYKTRHYVEADVWSKKFPNDVTAAVTMWGVILEYEHGYRAEHMQIDHIWLDGPSSYGKERQAAALTARYGVGCEVTKEGH